MTGLPPVPEWAPSWASTWLLISLDFLALYTTTLVVYRRFFHPLAQIPGPLLPAVTRFYAFYFNVVKTGEFYKEIERLHNVYGPIVRIAPDEIHLSNPANYDKIYTVGSKFYKDPLFYRALGVKYSIFTTVPNELHRMRRAPLNPFFSRREVLGLEEMVQSKVTKLCRRIEDTLDAGKPFDMHSGVRAISVDVVTEYAFDSCWDQLDQPDLGAWFSDMAGGLAGVVYTTQQWPFLVRAPEILPDAIARRIDKGLGDMIDCTNSTRDMVLSVQARLAKGEKPKRKTIFHELLDPHAGGIDRAPEEVPNVEDLAGESFVMTTAAADTTGNAMNVACYHVITKPALMKKAKEELIQAYPDPSVEMAFTSLEKLPFLSGIIKEGHRLAYGVLSRLPRITPAGGAEFDGYYVPEGTTVSMSSWMMHRDPSAFPNPEVFDPTRWMDPKERAAREKHLVPFSRGSRMCIGQNLAMCEIYITLANIFRRFDNLEAFETTDKDMVYVDRFSAFHPKGSKKFRVVRKKSS